MFSGPVSIQQRQAGVYGFLGLLYATENSALSYELPLLPEPETSQVSDSIRYGLEVKIAELNDLGHTVQDCLPLHHETIRVP